jgi:hypothetical protein
MTQPLADLNALLATLDEQAQAFARAFAPTYRQALAATRAPVNGPVLHVEAHPRHLRVRFSVPTPPGQDLNEQALAVARHLGTDDVRPGQLNCQVIHHHGNHLFTEVRLQDGKIEVIQTQVTDVW